MIQPRLFAFVLMPFDRAFDDAYKLGIQGAISHFNDMVAERVDEQIYREEILDRIYRQIDIADIIVADMSGQNPNVFYEVGYAHAKNKLCLLLTSSAEDIPFDLKHRRHIVYNGSISLLRQELIKDLTWARSEIEKQRKSCIKLTPQDFEALITRTNWAAIGEIIFKIDLENISEDRAVNIQAIYFYSTKAWKLYQDDKECPSSTHEDADLIKDGLETCHFLRPPLPWLQKGAWAQVKFKAEKTLAWVFRGEELKDSYEVRGRSLMRVVTPDGNFDYEIPVEVVFVDVPF